MKAVIRQQIKNILKKIYKLLSSSHKKNARPAFSPDNISISKSYTTENHCSFRIHFDPIKKANSYNLYGKTTTARDFKLIKKINNSNELNLSLPIGEAYEYYLTANMSDGNESLRSKLIELDTFETRLSVPPQPQNFTVTVAKDQEKTLTWTKVKTALEYVIYRSINKNKDFVPIALTKKTSYIDKDRTLLDNQNYYYRVLSKNKGGLSEFSTTLAVTPKTGKPIRTSAETLTDRGVLAIDLAGDKGGKIKLSAKDKRNIEYSKGVYLSWRSFSQDPKNNSYQIYRNNQLIISGLRETNWIDENGTYQDRYKVKGASDDNLKIKVFEIVPWRNHYLELQLFQPYAQTLPDGKVVSYTANDMSIGDLDGDGQLELIVKWDAGGKDNAHTGFTGTTIIDGYDVDFNTGKISLLWRIDLGINIRTGAHYTQFQVWDYDGDGQAEIALKTADGTTTYKSLDGTDKTLVETGYVGAVNVTSLSTDKFNDKYDYRNNDGFILSGPEYFTIFNGLDGTIIGTTTYEPARGDDSAWGDSKGNRVDRFLAATAYLDGNTPYIIMGRGYYTRTAVTAYYLADTDNDGIGDSIRIKWKFDSDQAGKEFEGQGNHNISVGDVDNDGKDEIIYGSIAFDHDGSVLYNTKLGHGDAMHLGDFIADRPGLELMTVKESPEAAYNVLIFNAATGEILMGYPVGQDVGRGVAADIDPTSPGAEFWATADDNYDFSQSEPSWDTHDSSVYSTTSNLEKLVKLADHNPSTNGLVFWDGDLLRELQDHRFDEKNNKPLATTLYKWDYQKERQIPLFESTEVYTSNGTKGNPGFSGDILGDWREEIILRVANDASKIRIYVTTLMTDYTLPTLLEDRQYRESLAWQNTAYNQPPHPSYLLSEGVLTAKLFLQQTDKNTILLNFTPASDGIYGHKVEGYQIWRWEKNHNKKELIAQLLSDQLVSTKEGYIFEDQTIESKKEYSYAVSAIVNGRSSYLSKIVSIKTTT